MQDHESKELTAETGVSNVPMSRFFDVVSYLNRRKKYPSRCIQGVIMRVHVYRAGADEAVTHPDVDPVTKLIDLVTIEVDERVYRVGDDAEIDVDVSVVELFGSETGHVVVHHCREIVVDISYTGAERKIKVHPSEHVKKVFEKAIADFGVSPADATDLALRLPGADVDLPTASPIGAFVAKGSCELRLDLVHARRPQG
jgi:ribosomal protein L21E